MSVDGGGGGNSLSADPLHHPRAPLASLACHASLFDCLFACWCWGLLILQHAQQPTALHAPRDQPRCALCASLATPCLADNADSVSGIAAASSHAYMPEAPAHQLLFMQS